MIWQVMKLLPPLWKGLGELVSMWQAKTPNDGCRGACLALQRRCDTWDASERERDAQQSDLVNTAGRMKRGSHLHRVHEN